MVLHYLDIKGLFGALCLLWAIFAAPVQAQEDKRAINDMRAEEHAGEIAAVREEAQSGFFSAVGHAVGIYTGYDGYRKVLAMLKRSVLVEDVARIAQEIRFMYSGKHGYAGISSEVLKALGEGYPLENPFKGAYNVGPIEGGSAYCVQADNINPVDCAQLYDMQWGATIDPHGGDGKGKPIVAKGNFREYAPPRGTAKCGGGGELFHTLYFCYR